MERNVNALIARARMDQSRSMEALKEARDTQRSLKAKLEALAMKEALLAGIGEVKVCRGEHSGTEFASNAMYAERTRMRLQALAREADCLERDRERMDRRMAEIQNRIASTTRLLEQLSRMK